MLSGANPVRTKFHEQEIASWISFCSLCRAEAGALLYIASELNTDLIYVCYLPILSVSKK